eukprot:TRINITY_DN4071_c0_g1_i2.p1 TRINITY_DN4071_c0_g1~~TRINITY_DN4071_c0_g1_i2.p1  ORF type:complete len:287 (-),score=82.20 TRINITY_DN4071_c0_g1_i2:50-910(-)
MEEVSGKIVQLCQGEGATQKKVVEELKKLGVTASLEQIASVLNGLLKSGQLQVLKIQGHVAFKTVNTEEREKFRGLGSEDRLIYQLIEQSKDRGIWIRDLRVKSNLQQPQITKILKALESRKLIKAVKSVVAKNRKVYMVYDVEPSREITGGAWYNEQDLDEDFIEVLHDQCYLFISNKSFASAEEVYHFIKESRVFEADLRLEDIQTVLNTLIFDGLVEDIRDPRGPAFSAKVLYKRARLDLPPNEFTHSPCSICPVFESCAPNGVVNPVVCPYLTAWNALPPQY